MARLQGKHGVCQGKNQDGHQGHDEQKTGSTAGVFSAEAPGLLRSELMARLVSKDGLVFRPMIFEQPAQLDAPAEGV